MMKLFLLALAISAAAATSSPYAVHDATKAKTDNLDFDLVFRKEAAAYEAKVAGKDSVPHVLKTTPDYFQVEDTAEDTSARRRMAPTFLETGDSGCAAPHNFCMIGNKCVANICVGAARAGESCAPNTGSSGQCETGSYCLCTDDSYSSCTCTEEKKKDEVCSNQFDCPTGYMCNRVSTTISDGKTCQAYGTVPDGGRAVHIAMCEYGLIFDRNTDKCAQVNTMTCTTDDDCSPRAYTNFNSFMYDAIFYTCGSDNTCAYTGPDCEKEHQAFLKSNAGKPFSRWSDVYGGSDYSKGLSLAKCLYEDVGVLPGVNVKDLEFWLPFFYGWDDSAETWATLGEQCGTPSVRCQVPLFCGGISPTKRRGGPPPVCELPFVTEGMACDNNEVCVEDGIVCNGATCEKGVKLDEACSRRTTATDTIVVGCAKGDCNYDTATTDADGTTLSGVCTDLASLPAGSASSGIQFCAFGTWFEAPAGLDVQGSCNPMSEAMCNTYRDCLNYFGMAVWPLQAFQPPHVYDYDYAPIAQDEQHIDDDSDYTFRYLWDYINYYDSEHPVQGALGVGLVECNDGTCNFIGNDKCAKLYYKAVETLFNPLGSSFDLCELKECLYKDVTAKGYNWCAPSASPAAAATPAVAAVVLLSAVLLAVL